MQIKLTYRGEEYVIPESQAFRAAEAVEEIATFADVLAWQRKPQFTKMARCMAVLLQIAGCKVAPESIWRDIAASYRAASADDVLSSILTLVGVLMDGAPDGGGKAGAPEKDTAS